MLCSLLKFLISVFASRSVVKISTTSLIQHISPCSYSTDSRASAIAISNVVSQGKTLKTLLQEGILGKGGVDNTYKE